MSCTKVTCATRTRCIRDFSSLLLHVAEISMHRITRVQYESSARALWIVAMDRRSNERDGPRCAREALGGYIYDVHWNAILAPMIYTLPMPARGAGCRTSLLYVSISSSVLHRETPPRSYRHAGSIPRKILRCNFYNKNENLAQTCAPDRDLLYPLAILAKFPCRIVALTWLESNKKLHSYLINNHFIIYYSREIRCLSFD